MLKKLTFISLLVFLLPLGLRAQGGAYELRGQVLSESGEPLIGATVIRHGLSRSGTLAGDKGYFSISVAPGDTITVSMLSYEDATVPVAGRRSLVVRLKESSEYLESVVLVGYGEQSAKDVTGAITAVDVSALQQVPVTDIGQALQGRVAGVVMNSADGQPGEDMNILIRGANSVTQDNSPLYVIDGFPTEDFSPSRLNPDDIKSISILKDASAGAIYGARGANGVVIIETKSGAGETRVSYDGSVGLQQVSKFLEVMDPYEYVRYLSDMGSGDQYLSGGKTLDDYKGVKGRNWQKEMMHTALVHKHSVGLSGGGSRTRYNLSLSYANQDGVVVGSGFERYQGRIKLEQDLLSNLVFKANMNYSQSTSTGAVTSEEGGSSGSWQSYLMYRMWSYSPIGYGTADEEEDDATVAITRLNPVISAENTFRNVCNSYFFGSASLVWTPVKDLKITEMFGYTSQNTETKLFNNSLTWSGFKTKFNNNGVNGSYQNDRRGEWVNDITANYKHKYTKRTVLTAMATFSMSHQDRSRYGYSARLIPDEDLGISGLDTGTPNKLRSSESEANMMSGLGRVNFSWDARYLITASVRADGSSKFPKGNRWGVFPSGALAWRIGNEAFMKRIRAISDAKLRVSWGITGNNRIGDNTWYTTIDYTDYYPHGTQTPSPAVGITNYANSALTWEKTEQLDAGADISLFGDRIALTVDVYDKTTRDLLLNAYIPYSTGLGTATLNVGSVRNRGVEISLDAVPVKAKSFEWRSSFNIAFNQNRVLALSGGQDAFTTAVPWTGDFSGTPLYITRVGGPLTAFYGLVWEGVYTYDDFDTDSMGNLVLKNTVPDNGNPRTQIQPGDIKYADLSGDGTISADDMCIIGSALPLHTGGLNNDFRWKRFSLNVFLQWSAGQDVFNANRIALEGNYAGRTVNQLASYADRWSPDNQDSKLYRAGGYGPRGFYSTRTLEDGSYLRVKNVMLSYDFAPSFVKKHLHMQSLQLALSCQNAWTFTSYSGMDPEVSTQKSALTPGFDYSAYPRNRVWTFNIKAVF